MYMENAKWVKVQGADKVVITPTMLKDFLQTDSVNTKHLNPFRLHELGYGVFGSDNGVSNEYKLMLEVLNAKEGSVAREYAIRKFMGLTGIGPKLSKDEISKFKFTLMVDKDAKI